MFYTPTQPSRTRSLIHTPIDTHTDIHTYPSSFSSSFQFFSAFLLPLSLPIFSSFSPFSFLSLLLFSVRFRLSSSFSSSFQFIHRLSSSSFSSFHFFPSFFLVSTSKHEYRHTYTFSPFLCSILSFLCPLFAYLANHTCQHVFFMYLERSSSHAHTCWGKYSCH